MEGLLWYINPYDDRTDQITLKDYKNNFSNFSPSVLTWGNIIHKQEEFEKHLIFDLTNKQYLFTTSFKLFLYDGKVSGFASHPLSVKLF